ncbi:CRAL/TRIO domain protein [Metarhizium album ARSEF 1941]|uniref:CRAL/TRIO domain protein n=1 Tax=Metarhizium album (strain ARSEF 1941) TaxID=1081103 RepID=A0A0B2WT77_METAS|nr:CRAL/TRIO domain protein [Metarhizium album ARSEF 1941]KHN96834.1 CRAL/TRIO domain protein [Metarhizium album ARSEF 1941]
MFNMQKRRPIRQSVSYPAGTAFAYKVPEGYIGNLTEEQEAKVRAMWAIGFKFIEICEADDDTSKGKTLEEKKYVPPAKQSSRLPRGASKTHEKYPTLVNEILSLLPTAEKNLNRLAQQAVEALDNWTPEMYRLIVQRVVKHEHPDALALRFLRACNWDIIKATTMMGKTIYWRTIEAGVDDDILKHGEGGAAEDEKNNRGITRALGADFMKQARWGKSFIHGVDRAGRPITHIRVRLHRMSDQSVESIERYALYLLELARLSLRHPIETGRRRIMANRFLFPAIWRLVRVWLDKELTSKVKFTYGKKGLRKWIAADQLMRGLGGEEDWEYTYVEPQPDENMKMNDSETRDRLLEERMALALQFEELTKEWVMNAQLSEKVREICDRRNRCVEDLAANYWELDPYVRARSLYDRLGYFRGADGVDWYPGKADEESLQEMMEKTRSIDSCGASHCEALSDAGDGSCYDSD